MRISDWSSDVCSSDLGRDHRRAQQHVVADLRRLPGAKRPGMDHRLAHLRQDRLRLCEGRILAPDHEGERPRFGGPASAGHSSDHRRVGNAFVIMCRSWWSPFFYIKNYTYSFTVI